jgi:hypothetical protein
MTAGGGRRIVIDLPDAARLFSTDGSTPFEADYEAVPGIERIIEEVARMPDLAARGATLVLRLGDDVADEARLREAIARYCRAHAADSLRQADAKKGEGLHTLRLSAVIVAVAAGLIVAVERAALSAPTQSLLSNVLVIAAWVAIWRPLDLLLYEPWLLRRQARILRAVEAMPVVIEPREA